MNAEASEPGPASHERAGVTVPSGASRAMWRKRSEGALFLGAMALVACVVFWVGGGARFFPSSLAWVSTGDGFTHQTGWEFFRRQPVTFPLGELPGFLWPAGTSLSQTDSIPLLALALRPIAQWLPEEFQYFGLWIFACHLASAAVAWALLRRLGVPALARFCGTVVVGTSAFLFSRWVHAALCAHFLVLGAFLWAALPEPSWRRRALALGLGLSIAVHPYLAAMVVVIVVVVAAGSPRRAWDAVLHLAAAVSTGTLIGVVDGGGGELAHARGYGTHQFDVLGCFNGPSSRLGQLVAFDAPMEGHAYLGAGVLLWVAYAAVMSLVERGQRSLRLPAGAPRLVLLASFILGVHAVSLHVTVAGHDLLDLREYSLLLHPIPSVLRTTGRFAWPLAYVLMLGSIVAMGAVRARSASVVLAVGLVLQLVDVVPSPEVAPAVTAPDLEPFRSVAAQYDRIELIPPAYVGVACAGSDPGDGTRYQKPSWVASRLGWEINSGYAARPRTTRLAQYCGELPGQVADGPRARTLYILDETIELVDQRYQCGETTLGAACVDARNEDPLAAMLRRGTPR